MTRVAFHVDISAFNFESIELKHEFLKFRPSTALKEEFGSDVATFWMETASQVSRLFVGQWTGCFFFQPRWPVSRHFQLWPI